LFSELQKTQLAGVCHCFSAILHLKFVKDDPGVTFHRTQGKEKPLADLAIRESQSNKP
jgi:hypothetical protein